VDTARDVSIGLNENHLRRAFATCRYTDKLLVAIEAVLGASASDALFNRYEQTLPPDCRVRIVDSIGRLRRSMVDLLARHHLNIPKPSGDPAFAIDSTLMFIDDAVEELRPEHMGGYGALDASAAASLEDVVRELRGPVREMKGLLAPIIRPLPLEGNERR
jgi:hypothetical protein